MGHAGLLALLSSGTAVESMVAVAGMKRLSVSLSTASVVGVTAFDKCSSVGASAWYLLSLTVASRLCKSEIFTLTIGQALTCDMR